MGEEDFGPYRMVELLGRGGMGEVWRAVDTSHDDRVVALKLLGRWLSDDPAFARRFRRESALAAKVSCPHMVSVHRYGDIDGRLFIDMQLVIGVDLGTLLDTGGPLDPGRAVEIIAQTARALDTAHRAGLLHRDVKPSNILISNYSGDDHVYLIDFGIARAVEDTRMSTSGAVVGTLAYMAPERFAGEGDRGADIYALGCVLHQALTGDPPFTATNPLHLLNAHQNLPPPPPSTLRAGVPTGMDGVVAKALAKHPADRYQSASELAQAARQALGTSAEPATTIDSLPSTWPASTFPPAPPALATTIGRPPPTRPATPMAPPPTRPYTGQPWPSGAPTRRTVAWPVLVRGILAVLFGLFALVGPGSLMELVIVFGAFAVLDGVMAVATGLRHRRDRASSVWHVLLGVGTALAGVVVLFSPWVSSVREILIVLVFWIVLGAIVEIIEALSMRRREVSTWGWMLAAGVLGVLSGIAFMARPDPPELWQVGAYVMAFGAVLIWWAFQLRRAVAAVG